MLGAYLSMVGSWSCPKMGNGRFWRQSMMIKSSISVIKFRAFVANYWNWVRVVHSVSQWAVIPVYFSSKWRNYLIKNPILLLYVALWPAHAGRWTRKQSPETMVKFWVSTYFWPFLECVTSGACDYSLIHHRQHHYCQSPGISRLLVDHSIERWLRFFFLPIKDIHQDSHLYPFMKFMFHVYIHWNISGWWFGCHFVFSHILGICIIIPIDDSYFSEGWPNHQPDITIKIPNGSSITFHSGSMFISIETFRNPWDSECPGAKFSTVTPGRSDICGHIPPESSAPSPSPRHRSIALTAHGAVEKRPFWETTKKRRLVGKSPGKSLGKSTMFNW